MIVRKRANFRYALIYEPQKSRKSAYQRRFYDG